MKSFIYCFRKQNKENLDEENSSDSVRIQNEGHC